MSAPILEAEGLAYRYPDGREALRGVDLALRADRRVAVVGANGSGKTTLLLLLAGLLAPGRGVVRLDGRPAARDRAGLDRWRERVGLVFQNPEDQLFSASVFQDVSFGPLNLGLDEAQARQRTEEALAAMGLDRLRRRPVQALSFGQKKRAAIAGVLAMRPGLLLLDEPTAGLDPRGEDELLAALDRLWREGTALVLATHDLDLAWSWADETLILDEGLIRRRGPTETVLADGAELAALGLRLPRALAGPGRRGPAGG